MRLHIIGSGAGGSPGSRRWRAASLLETGAGLILIDCGVGCHYKLSDKGLLADIDYVLITHSHMDHFLGLPEALFQAHIDGRTKPISIYAPRIVEETLRIVSPHVLKSSKYPVRIYDIKPGTIISSGVKIAATNACHNTAEEAYSFRIEAGLSILFTGDTSPQCKSIYDLGRGTDVMVHEATCNQQYADICAKYAHTTTQEAIADANAIGAELLILTHIDERFNPTIYQDVKDVKRPLIVAEDNMIINL
ncbi:MAG: MBL fold metallo-hydrolase [Pyrobaculum sp.]